MNISQYIIYIPYRMTWSINRSFRKLFKRQPFIVFYCGTPIDYAVYKNLLSYFPNAVIVAKNSKVKAELISEYGVKNCRVYPAFPDVLIAARHVVRKFPAPKMIKFGMRHGAYHFKDFVSSKRYNAFNYYFVTSRKEVELAREKGITNAVAIGFPKMDDAFNGTIDEEKLEVVKKELNVFEPSKPTIIFTATWERSGMSAVEVWANRLNDLTNEYNILVTLHPWVSDENKRMIKNNNEINYITHREILPYLMISDVMVGDISSIIAEFCALNKPIITFRTTKGKRFSEEIRQMLDKISFRVDTFEELRSALEDAVQNPMLHSESRKIYNKIMFDQLDGKATERMVTFIRNHI